MSKTIKSEIKLTVELDENRVPEKLSWTAKDGGVNAEDAKAMLLSIWDSNQQETLRIDLWTKDMPVDEMKVFFHQTLVAMADTYHRATEDEKMTATMRDFCDYFAEKLDLKK
ncbi:gliding motility protein GldC [Flavobacterium sp.]|uniref:gliding motility protein GldC n=1 Tax=Flavobacterium sp. TaxID=239 RepID=UPI0028BD63C7|nr:gliding motility protein GldC [Flavobacterium sp.]